MGDILKARTKKNILVIGGTGFCGTHLTRRLLNEGHNVRVLSRRGNVGLSPWALEMIKGADIKSGDVLSRPTLLNLMKGIDTVFHVASSLKSRNSDDAVLMDIDLNLKASVQIVETAGQSEVKRIVYFSSAGAVYGHSNENSFSEQSVCNPISSYGTVKLASEHYITLISERMGIESLIIRLTNPFGPGQHGHDGQGIMAVFLQKALKKQSISIFSDGSAGRDYIYISDATEAITALDKQNATGVYNIGSGHSHTISEIADAVEFITKTPLDRISVPPRHIADVGLVKINTSKLQATGFKSKFNLHQGLAEHYNWINDYRS